MNGFAFLLQVQFIAIIGGLILAPLLYKLLQHILKEQIKGS